jgi:hypothetical protein
LDFIIQGVFCIFAAMDNRKPTLTRIGKIDDPKVKSRGGPYIILLDRSFEQEKNAIFNFDPDIVFYNMAKAKQLSIGSLWGHETSFHFSRWIK